MIPKIIHYCWFGGKPLPELAQKCIASWKKFLPEYEIKEWNEQNFDVGMISYTAEAFEAKKYAFVSDFARFWILYHHGGLYFDTDVEVLRSLEDITSRGAFMGCESTVEGATALSVAPGLGLGCNPGLLFYSEMIEIYSRQHFRKLDGSLNFRTVVEYTTELLIEFGLKNINEIQFVADIYIYPVEYFSPMNMITNKLEVTENTYTIHHYAGSWISKRQKIKGKIYRFISNHHLLKRIYQRTYKKLKK